MQTSPKTEPGRPRCRSTAKPEWLKKRLPTGKTFEQVRNLLHRHSLNTVCQEARCPNIWECYARRTATFLINGPNCTRNCRYCSVQHGPSAPPSLKTPLAVAKAARDLNLAYVVVTAVTRDDIPDGGATLFAETITQIRKRLPEAAVEVLIPDLDGNWAALDIILGARPNVLNHNIETVRRLFPEVRPQADYDRSLQLLQIVARSAPHLPTKSGLMLGLGETPDEIRQTLTELLATGCRLLTLGQYLQPTQDQTVVDRFVPPEEFDQWRHTALEMGFAQVASGPFVRSSFEAHKMYAAVTQASNDLTSGND